MSYIRKKTIHPSAMGGVDEHESMYGGGKRRHRKTRAKTGGKRALKSYGGVMASRHVWGSSPGITTRKNVPSYGRKW